MDPGSLTRLVRDALEHLHNRPRLGAHALAATLGPDGRPLTGEQLRRLLLDAIEQLRPVGPSSRSDGEWRQYRQLVLRHAEGQSRDQSARAIGVSARQASRDHERAVEALASVLRRHREQEGPPVGGDDALGGDVAQEASKVAAAEEGATDVAAAVTSALATLRNLAADQRVSFSTALDDPLPAVAIGRTLLRQAMLNVLMHAVRLSPGARIMVAASDTARGIVVKVRPAPGPTATVDARSAGSGAPDGPTLLGAARQLLEAQGGALDVAGPVDDEEIVLVLPPVPLHTVLVVDDNPDVVSLFQRYLRGEPYRVVQATSGEVAHRLATALRPDVLVLDVMLPSQDGWEVLQRLRDDPATRAIPVVVCSVLPERDLALSLGVAEFLAKPVTRTALIATLERWCPPRGTRRDRPSASASLRPR
jgi:CheY-like chemotaxis protein